MEGPVLEGVDEPEEPTGSTSPEVREGLGFDEPVDRVAPLRVHTAPITPPARPAATRRVHAIGASLRSERGRTWFFRTLLLCFLVALVRWCRTMQEAGHDWGDDFSLYLRQSKALVKGFPQRVVSDTYFSVSNSGWEYSPFAYPWGFPIMMAPIVALWGIDYPKLKLLETLLFVGFLFLFHRLVRRRTGDLVALLLVVAIGSNFFLVSWTNAVLSEYPFMFGVIVAMLCMDRYRRLGAQRNANLRPAIVVGLSLAWAVNIRREALGLPLGLVVLQAVEGIDSWRTGGRGVGDSVRAVIADHRRRAYTWRDERVAGLRRLVMRLAVPYLSFGGAVVAFQLLMPSDLLPTAGESTARNIPDSLRWYRGILAELLGLKDAGDVPYRYIHDVALGEPVFRVVVACFLVGLVGRVILQPRRDAWLAGSVAGLAYVVLAAPFHDGRYLYAVFPFFLYFAAQALPTLGLAVERFLLGRPRAGTPVGPDGPSAVERLAWPARVVSAVLLVGIVATNVPGTKHALDYHRDYAFVENGPETPEAKEMLDAVRRFTRPDDVILFFRSRAMMLYTDRRAVQNADLIRMRTVADWYVMENGSSYGQTPIEPGQEATFGVAKVWSNNRFTLWRFLSAPEVPVTLPPVVSPPIVVTVPPATSPPATIPPAITAGSASASTVPASSASESASGSAGAPAPVQAAVTVPSTSSASTPS